MLIETYDRKLINMRHVVSLTIVPVSYGERVCVEATIAGTNDTVDITNRVDEPVHMPQAQQLFKRIKTAYARNEAIFEVRKQLNA